MLAVADEITVVRRGTTVATVKPADVTSHKLAELMVGSELPSPSTEESTVTDRVLLSVRDIELQDAFGRVELADISFDIHAGEVLGIAGVEGNGQTELVETLVGMRHPVRGNVPARRGRHHQLVDPRPPRGRDRLHPRGPAATRAAARLTAVGEPHPRPPDAAAVGEGPLAERKGARGDSERIVEQYDVRTPGIDTTARALSGGNQQKFIVGREMSGDPVLLVASHPTRGVDVGAQAQIWGHIKKARREGWRCC